MAAGSTADILPVLTTAYGREITQQLNQFGTTLASLVRFRYGKYNKVFWAASTGGSTVTDVAAGGSYPAADNNNSLGLSLTRGVYGTAFSVDDNQEVVADNDPEAPYQDLLGLRFKEKAWGFCSTINSDLFKGTGTGTHSNPVIVGLRSALVTSGTYGGLDVGTYPGLASNISGSDGANTTLTPALMRTDISNIQIRGGETPIAIVMHPWVHDKWLDTVLKPVTSVQFLNGQIVPMTNVGAMTGNGVSSTTSFDGIPIIRDKDGYVSGTPGSGYGDIYYIGRDSLVLDVLPTVPTEGQLAKFKLPMVNTNGSVETMLPFMFNVALKGRTGMFDEYGMHASAQLLIRRPNACGIRKGIAI